MSALGDKKLEKMLQTFCALYLVPGASCHVVFRKCMNTYADGRSQKGVCFWMFQFLPGLHHGSRSCKIMRKWANTPGTNSSQSSGWQHMIENGHSISKFQVNSQVRMFPLHLVSSQHFTIPHIHDVCCVCNVEIKMMTCDLGITTCGCLHPKTIHPKIK